VGGWGDTFTTFITLQLLLLRCLQSCRYPVWLESRGCLIVSVRGDESRDGDDHDRRSEETQVLFASSFFFLFLHFLGSPVWLCVLPSLR